MQGALNAIRAELLKTGYWRATWVAVAGLLLASAVATTLMTLLVEPADLEPERIRYASVVSASLGTLVAAILGARSFGSEYKTHALTSILARNPSRSTIFTSKIVGLVSLAAAMAFTGGVGGLLGLIVGAAAKGGGAATIHWGGHTVVLWIGGLAQAWLVMTSPALVCASFALLTRSTSGGVALYFGFTILFDVGLVFLLERIVSGLSDYLYLNAASSVQTLINEPMHHELTFAIALLTLSAWTASLLAASGLVFLRRDVT